LHKRINPSRFIAISGIVSNSYRTWDDQSIKGLAVSHRQ
jgi:hypothetical protein